MAALLHPEAAIDRGIGKLSPEAAVAFFMILAAVNSHGKMDGDLFVLKGRCFRHIEYITMENLPGLLRELSQHTSVKWWTDPEGNSWIHVKNYAKWNPGLREDRMGKDKLPSWPGAETEKAGEVEVEGEGEVGSLSISINRRVVPEYSGTTPGVLPEQMKNGNEEQNRKGKDSSEAQSASEPPPTLLAFPTIGPIKEWPFTEALAGELAELYPGHDVLASARAALAWVKALPSRRKTAKGMRRFLTAWIERDVNGRKRHLLARDSGTRESAEYANQDIPWRDGMTMEVPDGNDG